VSRARACGVPLPRRWRWLRGSKGRWLVAGLVVLLLAAAVGLGLLFRGKLEAVDPTWEQIQATGVMRVCMDPSWPPFESTDEESGQIEGLDVDLARRLAARLSPGVRAQIVPVGFDGLYDALLTGRCDVVFSALPYEPLRTEDVAYSVAYFNAGLVLVTRQDTGGIEKLEDVAGRVVAVEWGFVPEGDSRQQSFLESLGLRRYDTTQDALRALQSGAVEAAIVDRIAALTYLGECQGLQVVGEPISDVNYVAPMRPGSFRLIREVNRVLLQMRRDGTLESLQEKWF
jgi:polar amino acid transport system substrate-binding protein